MIQFPNKEDREKKKTELLEKANELLETVDENAINRTLERSCLGTLEDDNKLKVHADRSHMERTVDAIELLLQADSYK